MIIEVFYFWMCVVGVAAIWAFWTYLIQDFFLDSFRAVLFESRSELTLLVESGQLPYDDPAYVSLRLVINGLIRYGHKITFGLYLISSVHAASRTAQPDENNVGQQILLQISRQKPETKQRLLDINTRVYHACLLFMMARSVALQVAFILWFITQPFRKDDTKRVKDELVNQVQKDAVTAAQSPNSQLSFA